MTDAVTLIAGPTASGKSALATILAERTEALVVNADSMQVYNDLNVLTARPPAADLTRADHRLYGHVDAASNYSVATWCEEIAALLSDAREKARPFVIVGGTGLYFKALSEGLSPVPTISDHVRATWRGFAQNANPGELHATLAERDPAMAARLEPGDTQRLVRALEVLEETGRSLLDWQRVRSPAIVPASAQRVVLAPPRPWLHARIAERFSQMVEMGAIEEARDLTKRHLDPSLPAMKAIGVRELGALDESLKGLEDAMIRATTETRRLAKRQETFFRGQLGSWPRLDPSRGEAVDDYISHTLATAKNSP